MEAADVIELRESTLDLLMARFAGRPLDPDLVAEANAFVHDRFLQFGREGVLPILFGDGAILTGYDVAIDHERSSLGLSPRTDFYPSSRYQPVGKTPDDRIALGFCGRFDLWVVKQAPRPPVIIARYGDDEDDYLSANPEILGLAVVRRIGEPFPEALRRLVVLGLLADDGALAPTRPEKRGPGKPVAADDGAALSSQLPRRRRLFPWWPRRG
jgi:hypothetical protein